MKASRLLVCFILYFSIQAIQAQQSVSVQALTYESQTRDTVIDFSGVENMQCEKILMYYSMRCKDGLVSPPIQGQTNIGCGEWDYSCNTYIVDSTLVDSIRTTSPNHQIAGFSGEMFNYTSQPTYNTYLSNQKEVSYAATNSENNHSYGSGSEENDAVFADGRSRSRSQHIYSGAELQNIGLTAGDLTGLKMDLSTAGAVLNNLRIGMKHHTADDFSNASLSTDGFTEVYYLDTEISGGEHFFRFYEAFVWDGSSSIIVDISYSKDDASQASMPMTTTTEATSIYADASRDKYVELSGFGDIEIERDFTEIENEITVSFWNYGRPEQPINSSVFEGVDDANRRQINVHGPWSNGQVYWDCGNDGGGYDRINKPAPAEVNEGNWHHWAFTKNANTGNMSIYLDGVLWHEGVGKTKSIDLQRLVIGMSAYESNPHFGKIDDFQIWNKALNAIEIRSIMREKVDASNPNYANLVLYYDFDQEGTAVADQSMNGIDGNFDGLPTFRQYQSQEVLKNISYESALPNMTFVQGSYVTNVNEIEVATEIENTPYQVKQYEVIGTDLTLVDTYYTYEAGDMPIFDEDGNEVGSVNFPMEGIIYIFPVDHYTKQASSLELMSFVTPYGINLDLGIEGKTWVFDVTDFAPVFNGQKRIYLSRGGQWQEDMDIRFEFVEGTPTREVLSIQQIWPVISRSYTDIISNAFFEPRDVYLNEDASMYKLKAAITGHGQEGEFIPRTHFLNVNGGNAEMLWQVWKECADNPVYPQGGTWIYDRAGWCPGEATDIQELDITNMVSPGTTASVDYGVATGTGDSRYIVNVQMVSYGPPNFSNDAELVDIIHPSDNIAHGRYNPICGEPKIQIRNNGTETMTSLQIEYGVDGKQMRTYTWNGSLHFLQSTEVTLPALNPSDMLTPDGVFRVRITDPNGDADNYAQNNEKAAGFSIVPTMSNNVVIRMRTNSAAHETSYRVLDSDGNIIVNRSGGLSPNTIYIDSLNNIEGCYRLLIEDSGDDGISFWANNDGDGFVQIKDEGGIFQTIATDFGKFIQYDFIAGNITSTHDLADDKYFEILPNPNNGRFQVELQGFEDEVYFKIMNHLGQSVYQDNVGKVDKHLHIQTFDLSAYPAGMYLLEVIENGKSRVEKFVVE